jgi:glycosyltransferase involved in cell wall biosynthesis
MFLDALHAINMEHEVYLFCLGDEDRLSSKYKKANWHWIDLRKELQLPKPSGPIAMLPAFFKGAVKAFLAHMGIIVSLRRNETKKQADSNSQRRLRLIQKAMSKHKIDFIFFPIWTDYCWEWGIPFAFVVHDLQHRIQPEFPEVSLIPHVEWNRREEFFSRAIARARLVVADSEEGKRNVLRFYDCDAGKIRILPYTLPSCSTIKVSEERRQEVVDHLNIPRRFFFYPANFWLHKNHYRIIEAIGLVKRIHGVEIPIVFVGKTYPEWETSPIFKTLAGSYSVEDQIYYRGYVSDEKLAALYKTAVGLVMPTYFGPTNIPYIEAFFYECPVIASDIPGIREQVGKAALLVNPKDTEAISNAMYRIWTDKDLRKTLAEKGQRQLEEFLPEHFREKVKSMIDSLPRKKHTSILVRTARSESKEKRRKDNSG